MTTRLGKFYAIPFALATTVVLWGAPPADADFQVTLSAGGASTTITDGGGGDDNPAANRIGINSELVGGYEFTFTLAVTNSPGGPTVAFVNTSTGMIQNVSGGSAATTVSIYASANDFTAPTTPPPIRAETSATIQYLAPTPTGNVAEDVLVESRVDTTNSLSATPTGTVIGFDSDTITAGGTPANNADLDDTEMIALLASPYALNLLLSADLQTPSDTSGDESTIDLDGTVRLTNVVPEPTTLAAAFTALPLLGGFYLRRRMKKEA